MKTTLWVGIIGLLVLATFLPGCGGGGGAPLLPAVTLNIGADTDVGRRAASLPALTAPLDAGATIDVYDFRNGQKIKSGTTGATGFGEVLLTPGLNVAVVVTGTRVDKPYRLSGIIAMVPSHDQDYVVYPLTTIVAEAIAQTYYKKNQVVDEYTIGPGTVLLPTVQDAADAYQSAPENVDADISIGAGLIEADSVFGSAGSLNAALAAVIAAVPATIDNNLVLAKNAVGQIQEAGLYLSTFASDEESVFKSYYDTLQSIPIDEVQAKYTAVFDRLSLLLLPAVGGGFTYQGESYAGIFAGLTMGKRYQLAGGVLTDSSPDTPGHITIDYPTGGGPYHLVATVSGTIWTITQTSDGDLTLEYLVVMPTPTDELGPNPSLTGRISLKDKDLTTPVTFEGTATAKGLDQDHYTHATFNGTLTSAEVTASGSFAADFPATKPAGADPDEKIYDFPTRFSMSNGKVEGTIAPLTASLSGNIAVTTKLISIPGEYPDAYVRPAQVTLDGTLTLDDGQKTVTLSGKISWTGTWVAVGDTDKPSSMSARSEGDYSDSSTELAFSGTMSGTWRKATSSTASDTGTLTLVGSLERPKYGAYSANLRVAVDGAGVLSLTITKLQFGAYSLTGSGTVATLPSAPASGSLDLTNQAGVKFHLVQASSYNWSGTITVSGQQMATITAEANGMLKITFSDGTIQYLPK